VPGAFRLGSKGIQAPREAEAGLGPTASPWRPYRLPINLFELRWVSRGGSAIQPSSPLPPSVCTV